MGMFRRKKNFLNVGNVRLIKDTLSAYQYENAWTKEKNMPMFIVYLGITKSGMNFERIEYGMMQLISNAGGFINAIHKSIMAVIYFVCVMNINA